MSRPPTGTAGRYLDVLRSLGVPDAAVRRHHGVPPDASLRASLDEELSAPTDRLLELLAGAGAVVDLEATATEDDVLAASLARFGFDVECTAVGGDVEVVATDRLGDFVTHLRTGLEPVALREALTDRLLEEAGVVAAPTVDGRTLLADRAALARLQALYGPRLEPFSTPLLGVEAPSIEPPPGVGAEGGAAAATPRPPAAEAPPSSASVSDAPSSSAPSPDAPPAGDPSPSGSSRSATPDPDRDDASPTDVDASPAGVDASSASDPAQAGERDGIDDVFDDIESAAASERRRQVDGDSPDPFTRPLDASEDASANQRGTASSGASDATDDGGPELAGGTPKRTVSETSADDILARARGDADFEDVASDRDPDPDAVLSEAAESDAAARDAAATDAPDAAATDASDVVATDASDSVATDAPDVVATDASDTAATDASDSVATDAPDGDERLGDGEGELTLPRGESSTDGPLAERGGLWSEDAGTDPAEDTGGLPDEIRSILGRQNDDR